MLENHFHSEYLILTLLDQWYDSEYSSFIYGYDTTASKVKIAGMPVHAKSEGRVYRDIAAQLT